MTSGQHEPSGHPQVWSQREGRGSRLGRRLAGLGRFATRHRSSLWLVFGALMSAVTVGSFLIGLEVLVQLLFVLTAVTSIGIGAAIRAHESAQADRRNPNVYRPTRPERRQMADNVRTGREWNGEPRDDVPDNVVHVDSHRKRTGPVDGYTRARPGKAVPDDAA